MGCVSDMTITLAGQSWTWPLARRIGPVQSTLMNARRDFGMQRTGSKQVGLV